MYCDLLSGVTTMRCLGEIDNIDVALKDASEKGIVPGAPFVDKRKRYKIKLWSWYNGSSL